MPDTDTGTAAEQAPPTPAIVENLTPASPERSSEWFDRLLGRGRATDQPVSDDQANQGSTEPDAPAPKKLELTEDELSRYVQAEADRREAKRQQAEKTRNEREQRQSIRAKDPYLHAQLEEEEERQLQQLATVTGRVATDFDEAIVDPLVGRLTDAQKAEVVAKAANLDGLQGRKAITEATLDLLLKNAREQGAKDAEKKLRSNPAFIKQTLATVRDVDEEPDLAPASGTVSRGSGVTSSDVMNGFLRGNVGRRMVG